MIENQQKIPNLFKLGASLLYELLAVIALAFFSASIFYLVLGDATVGYKRVLLQLFIWLLIGAYFVRSWVAGGQTLAMRSWKLRLCDDENISPTPQTISLKKAVWRYVLCSLNLACLGLGFFYSFFDAKRRFLHDKLLHTHIADEAPQK